MKICNPKVKLKFCSWTTVGLAEAACDSVYRIQLLLQRPSLNAALHCQDS